jgi:hypothetical protein
VVRVLGMLELASRAPLQLTDQRRVRDRDLGRSAPTARLVVLGLQLGRSTAMELREPFVIEASMES